MAPKRKPRDANSSAATTTRVTRSSARHGNSAVPPPVADPEPRRRKKSQTAESETPEPRNRKKPKTESPAAGDGGGGVSRTIIIEHCKQCNSFKTRAIQVKLGLEKGVEGVKVRVNPEKPRMGCFEIREEGGRIFVSLLNMKRPFKPMKDLDMNKLISDIVEKISP